MHYRLQVCNFAGDSPGAELWHKASSAALGARNLRSVCLLQKHTLVNCMSISHPKPLIHGMLQQVLQVLEAWHGLHRPPLIWTFLQVVSDDEAA